MVRTFWVGSPQLPIVDSNEDACDNGSSTCKTLTISFDKTTTDGLTDFTVSNQSCTWCNIYTTGSFAAGSITVWNIHAGECINVTGTAYNACGSTSFSEVFCNGQTPRQVEDIEVRGHSRNNIPKKWFLNTTFAGWKK